MENDRSDEVKLEPCPHCGGTAAVERMIVKLSGGKWRTVTCPDCECRVGLHKTKAEAIAAWNRRPPRAENAQVAEPVGWVLVPREPTEAMLLTQGKSRPDLAKNEKTAELARQLNADVRAHAAGVYREMIAASPPAPQAEVTEAMIERAHEAYAKTTGGMMDGHPMRNALSAALSIGESGR